ncbi:MAG: hypothetical protein OIN86_11420 [Candidatus Methanoperedens sp.]|nr:hypothetical protein [Candidatus Methanoperedens sp.]CAG0987285.1 hypothetical protein METP1_02101 [Methanosarcinales archaeon]
MSVRDEIHAQIVGGLAGAKFPIKTPEQLLAAFPNGANTTCKASDLEVTAGDQYDEDKTYRKRRCK